MNLRELLAHALASPSVDPRRFVVRAPPAVVPRSPFDAIAIGKGLFQAFKYGIDRGFRLIARKTRTLNDVMDNVLFYQRVHPLLQGIACRISGYHEW